ncbi:MAG: peptidase M16 [Solibacterales bacterium]|nr:peptidase M16 [Bryobacterales bacterium]|tara:strand:+ start:17264 stop:18832 length:1569 start_codon:yes stop_codon:yes gene_type:complete
MFERTRRLCFTFLLAVSVPFMADVGLGQRVTPSVHTLKNGMKFLFVPRKGDPNVSCGWIAKVGSVNERPGVTGVAHLFEHMMFKGTHAIGTSNIQQDLKIIQRLDVLRSEIRQQEESLLEKHRRGVINNPKDPTSRSEQHKKLLTEFNALLEQQRELIIKDEFSRLYRNAGGSGMNAGTSWDYTIYFVNVPANKIELWFWMESDRLANPVFREFYSERDVVYEERRMRVDSTPTGKLDEQFNAMFWQSSPYSWPVIGWPSDLEGITRKEALDFFSVHYAPNNLTAVLVGDFDPKHAKIFAERYFGRLKRGPRRPEPIRTREINQLAERRLAGYAETVPTVKVRYHTVADAHVDEPVLIVLAGILNGRTGRLYKSLVLDQEIATNAGAGVSGLKFDGYFSLIGVAAKGHKPREVEEALYAEIEGIKQTLVDARELQKVKNQQLAGDFRRLRSKSSLMMQLLVYDAMGSWQNINKFSDRIQAVTRSDIQRIAKKYFHPSNRTVAIYHSQLDRIDPSPTKQGVAR